MSLEFLLGGETLSDCEVAWKSKDWDTVKKMADSFKESGQNEFFAILNQINKSKQRLCVDFIESYSPFAINNELSKHIDCAHHTYVMNLLGDNISDQMHYDYLLHAVRSGSRYGGAKAIADPIDKIVDATFQKAIARYYNVGPERAKEYIDNYFDDTKKMKMKIMLQSSITDNLIKEACPYAKKAEIDKVMRVVKNWHK